MTLEPIREKSVPARTVLTRTGWLVLMAAILGTAANFVSPKRIAWVEDWREYVESKALEAGISLADTDDTRRIVKEGSAIVFDARPLEDYDAGHISGAMSFPYDPFETISDRLYQYEALLIPEQQILTYCSGQNCDESFMLATFLKEQGFTNIVLYVDGWTGWAEAQP